MLSFEKAVLYSKRNPKPEKQTSIPVVEERGPDGGVIRTRKFYYRRWWMPEEGRYAFPVLNAIDAERRKAEDEL